MSTPRKYHQRGLVIHVMHLFGRERMFKRVLATRVACHYQLPRRRVMQLVGGMERAGLIRDDGFGYEEVPARFNPEGCPLPRVFFK